MFVFFIEFNKKKVFLINFVVNSTSTDYYYLVLIVVNIFNKFSIFLIMSNIPKQNIKIKIFTRFRSQKRNYRKLFLLFIFINL